MESSPCLKLYLLQSTLYSSYSFELCRNGGKEVLKEQELSLKFS